MNYLRSHVVSEQVSEDMNCMSPRYALPRVSVIITCFNYGRFIVDALDSVLTQTYANFDCVIVDDASADDSAALIESWIKRHDDPRFRFIPNPTNRGQTASFVKGLAETNGEFVAFLDADDFWFPYYLQRHVEAHLNRAQSVSLSYSDLVQIDEERRILSGTLSGLAFLDDTNIEADRWARLDLGAKHLEFSDNLKLRYIRPSYIEHPSTVTSGMVFRRAALSLVMPDNPESLRICTDWYIFVICHYLTGSLAISSALGAYRRHGNNNFASNPVMGLPSIPSAIARNREAVLNLMIKHLLDHYTRFIGIFSAADIQRLVRILFTIALRERILVDDRRLRDTLGIRGFVESWVKARLTVLRRIRSVFR